VFEKRAKENHSSSVYRQTESRLERFKLVASRRFCLDSIFFTNLGRRQIEMDASIALRLALSVNRRAWSDLNLEHPKKYADRWFQPVQQNMLFNKDTSFLLRRRHPRIWRQRRYRFWFRARPGDWSLCGRLSIRRGCGVYWAGRWILRADRPCSACRLGASLLVVMSRTPR
jgi:hypothetical protein